MSKKEVMFSKEFKNNGKAFSAYSEAEKFLKENGFSYGSMERGNNIGVYKGNAIISKWSNLSKKDIDELDGFMSFPNGSPRNGDVVIRFYVEL